MAEEYIGPDRRDPNAQGRRWEDKEARMKAELALQGLEDLKEVARQTLAAANRGIHLGTMALQQGKEHNIRCDGRDERNEDRYVAIDKRLTRQDKVLWWIIGLLVMAGGGVATMAWDIIKAKTGL